jgi:hypothetical protein
MEEKDQQQQQQHQQQQQQVSSVCVKALREKNVWFFVCFAFDV